MPPTDPAATDPKQPSFDALNALVTSSTAAANNRDNTTEAQDAAWATRTTAVQELEALDLAVFTGNTVQLQAAAASMTPGMNQLNDLKKQIDALGNDFKEAAKVMGDIDEVVSALSALV